MMENSFSIPSVGMKPTTAASNRDNATQTADLLITLKVTGSGPRRQGK